MTGARRAAIAVTFDNLGEAADLERGRWPATEPLGEHFSVTRALLALHGWRHEAWSGLDVARERELLARGLSAFDRLGLAVTGFRPPGGVLTGSSWRALAAAGMRYCSPAGSGLGMREGLAALPFRWALLDAFHYLPDFAPWRVAALGAAGLLDPAALRARLHRAISAAVPRREFLCLLFHPFLLDEPDRLEVLRSVLTEVRRLVCTGTACCAPLREIAGWVADQPGAGAWPLSLES